VLHLRLIVPPDRCEEVTRYLMEARAATNLARFHGAAVSPAGDLIQCDVAREAASEVLARLREIGLDRDGSIAVEQIDVSLSRAAERAEAQAPGMGGDAVVWEEVEAKTGEESDLSVTYLAFMSVATMIAGFGVLLDQPILIIGAMVVGPEFGPLAGLCVAIVTRRAAEARQSLLALLVGFPVGILVTILLTWVLTACGLVERSMLTAHRPLTDFIYQPDALSFVVAFLAGVAGTLSLTSAKSGALIGVLISVTTVPSAANAAVATAYGVWHEALGSLAQLGLNLSGIVTASLLVLLVQRQVWTVVRHHQEG
jgi:uncharacterized hydrophobic protein (TIGR00271 family)